MNYNDKFGANEQTDLEERIAALIFDWDYQASDGAGVTEQEANDMSKEILKLVVEELRPDLVISDKTRKWIISDGNAAEEYDNWNEILYAAEGWYLYLPERFDGVADAVLARDFDNIPEGDTEAFNSAIRSWEERIAQAAGYKDFTGHGNYSVSAASEMGLNLSVEEVE